MLIRLARLLHRPRAAAAHRCRRYPHPGLNQLETVQGDLVIRGAEKLPTLDGLAGLTSIGGNLEIIGANALTSLAGLTQLTSLGMSAKDTPQLHIANNPLLAECAVDALAAQLVGFTGDVVTSGNDETTTCP